MSRVILSAASFGLMLMTSPLAAQDIEKPVAGIQLPSVELPPELDRVLRDYERAWRAGDAEALASLFAQDGFVLQSSQPPIRGRPAILAAYKDQGKGGPLQLRALAFNTTGKIGYIIGAYGYGNNPGFSGKFTLTLVREPGKPWLIFSDIDNMDSKPQR